ncbi:hypothetical protein ONE63_004785 [Megalurothrips usitatus]|uniref:Uncharacterized protein n=1 Tax=Megalurothrips usitatus TaxID=439358 RepID=A0AAV7X3A1_9NEOP|nr:hypothetical protein ONE63_004785 [Megalurothrips usitatus]
MKLLLAVVATLALQALCVQSYSVADRQLVDKDNLVATLDELALDKRPIDSNDILNALQNILLGIDAQVQKAAAAVANATQQAIDAGEEIAAKAVEGWIAQLEKIIPQGVQTALSECEDKHPNLQDVQGKLENKVQGCVLLASAEAVATVEEIRNLTDQAQGLINQAEQVLVECATKGLLQPLCVSTKLPGLTIRGTILATKATILGVKVAGHLSVKIPAESSVCVGVAVAASNVEALGVIGSFSKCVLEYKPSTTEASTTTGSN